MEKNLVAYKLKIGKRWSTIRTVETSRDVEAFADRIHGLTGCKVRIVTTGKVFY